MRLPKPPTSRNGRIQRHRASELGNHLVIRGHLPLPKQRCRWPPPSRLASRRWRSMRWGRWLARWAPSSVTASRSPMRSRNSRSRRSGRETSRWIDRPGSRSNVLDVESPGLQSPMWSACRSRTESTRVRHESSCAGCTDKVHGSSGSSMCTHTTDALAPVQTREHRHPRRPPTAAHGVPPARRPRRLRRSVAARCSAHSSRREQRTPLRRRITCQAGISSVPSVRGN